jgi:hypothetical protein
MGDISQAAALYQLLRLQADELLCPAADFGNRKIKHGQAVISF